MQRQEIDAFNHEFWQEVRVLLSAPASSAIHTPLNIRVYLKNAHASCRVIPASMQQKKPCYKAFRRVQLPSSARSRCPTSTPDGSHRSARGSTTTARSGGGGTGRRSRWVRAYDTKSSCLVSCIRSDGRQMANSTIRSPGSRHTMHVRMCVRESGPYCPLVQVSKRYSNDTVSIYILGQQAFEEMSRQ